jgi:hypothetical protein
VPEAHAYYHIDGGILDFGSQHDIQSHCFTPVASLQMTAPNIHVRGIVIFIEWTLDDLNLFVGCHCLHLTKPLEGYLIRKPGIGRLRVKLRNIGVCLVEVRCSE